MRTQAWRRTCAIAVLLWAAVAVAQHAAAQTASFYQQLTVTATASGISGGAGSTLCRGTLETAVVRFTIDGSTPVATSTSTWGQVLNIGDQVVLGNAGDIRNFLAVRTTSTSGVLNLTCAAGTAPQASYIIPAPFFVFTAASTAAAPPAVAVTGGLDGANVTRPFLAMNNGVQFVQPYTAVGLPAPVCNPLLRAAGSACR